MKALSIGLICFAAIMFLGLPFAIWRPSLIGLAKRRHVALIWSFSIVVAMFGADLNPPPEQQALATPAAFILWSIGAGIVALAFKLWRKASFLAKPKPASLPLEPRRKKRLGFLVSVRDRLQNTRSDLLAYTQRVDQELTEKRRQADALASERRFHAARASKVASGPAIRFAEPAIGGITERVDWRGSSEENYDFTSGEDEGEYGAILRRGTDGRPLSFEYANKHGEISSRAVFDWVEYPRHFQGMCSNAGAVICFRKDRVIEWHAETNKLLRAPKGKSRQ